MKSALLLSGGVARQLYLETKQRQQSQQTTHFVKCFFDIPLIYVLLFFSLFQKRYKVEDLLCSIMSQNNSQDDLKLSGDKVSYFSLKRQ